MPKVVSEYRAQARSRILTAATSVFRRKGFSRATIEDIARGVGVSRAAVYLYFSSKLDMLKAIQIRDRARMEQRLARIAASADLPRTFAKLLDDFASHPSASQNYLEMFARAREDNEVREALLFDRSSDSRAIRSILDGLRASGTSLRVDDPEAAAILIRSVLVDAVLAYGLGGDREKVRRDLVRALRAVIGSSQAPASGYRAGRR